MRRVPATPQDGCSSPVTTSDWRYLVAPRGNTQWVRNLRAATTGELRVGRRRQTFTAAELPNETKLPILQAYLQQWGWEVGQFFEGVDKNATDAELEMIAPGFPVFRLVLSDR
jgi:hypothetical protein